MASIGIYCAYIYHGNSPKVCDFFIIHWVPAYTHSEDHLPTINYEVQAVKLQGCISWGPQPLQDASHHQDVTFLWLTDCGLNPLLATVKSGGKHPCINIYIYIFIFKYMYIYICISSIYPWSLVKCSLIYFMINYRAEVIWTNLSENFHSQDLKNDQTGTPLFRGFLFFSRYRHGGKSTIIQGFSFKLNADGPIKTPANSTGIFGEDFLISTFNHLRSIWGKISWFQLSTINRAPHTENLEVQLSIERGIRQILEIPGSGEIGVFSFA